jgi:shikimate dehydrogenase
VSVVAVPPDVARFGVVGHPVSHSLSPRIHAAFGRATGIGLDYGLVDAPLDGFVAAVERFAASGGRGLNVTLPFKVEAAALCGDRLGARAAEAGAVNTLDFRGGAIRGDNTDGIGLVADLTRLLEANGTSLAGATVLLLGAGGSARGIVGPLFDAGRVGTLTIAARDPQKAIDLAMAFAPRPIEAASFAQVDGRSFDVVVNATSASLAGASLPLSPRTYARARLAYDLMYAAKPTRFLVDARAGGTVASADGLGMLVEQAAEAFHLWHGVRPSTDAVRDALRADLDRSVA